MDDFQEVIKRAAHDVRTPLTTIAGFADLLVHDGSLSPTARDNAVMIAEETSRLTEMLQRFFQDIGPQDES
jgi:K+-sensing histidine kinase KdpD